MRRIALAAMAVACALLLASCGGDPFLGSWKYADSSSDARDIVIVKTSLGYRYTHVGDGLSSGWSPLERDGDTLRGTWFVPGNGGPDSTGWLSFTSDGGGLLYRDHDNGTGEESTSLLTKVSDDTTAPPPLGFGTSAPPPDASPAPTPATRSGRDQAALAYLARCSQLIDASADLADGILTKLEDGSWTQVTQDEAMDLQEAVMYSFFAVGDLFDPAKTYVPHSTSADIRRVLDGAPLGRSVGFLMGYAGAAEQATGVMGNPSGPTAADRETAPRLLRAMHKLRARYLAEHARLARELAALQRKYGVWQ